MFLLICYSKLLEEKQNLKPKICDSFELTLFWFNIAHIIFNTILLIRGLLLLFCDFQNFDPLPKINLSYT